MARDTPAYEQNAKERGLYAKHGDDPTLASYLSSVLYLISVPSFILIAYGGYWGGYWAYSSILPIFAGQLIAALIVVIGVMHGLTGR